MIDEPTQTAETTPEPDSGPAIDTDLIQRFEDELADAARTLEAVERIVHSGDAPTETVPQLNALVEDGRFVVEPVPTEPEPITEPVPAASQPAAAEPEPAATNDGNY